MSNLSSTKAILNSFICPQCKKPIEYVNTISQCTQKAQISKSGSVTDFEDPTVSTKTDEVNCPECNLNIINHTSQGN